MSLVGVVVWWWCCSFLTVSSSSIIEFESTNLRDDFNIGWCCFSWCRLLLDRRDPGIPGWFELPNPSSDTGTIVDWGFWCWCWFGVISCNLTIFVGCIGSRLLLVDEDDRIPKTRILGRSLFVGVLSLFLESNDDDTESSWTKNKLVGANCSPAFECCSFGDFNGDCCLVSDENESTELEHCFLRVSRGFKMRYRQVMTRT